MGMLNMKTPGKYVCLQFTGQGEVTTVYTGAGYAFLGCVFSGRTYISGCHFC